MRDFRCGDARILGYTDATVPSPTSRAVDTHERRRRELSALSDSLEARSGRLSNVRLLAFVIAASGVGAGLAHGDRGSWIVGGLGAIAFVAAVATHAVVSGRQAAAAIRRDIHTRHLERTTSAWLAHPVPVTRAPSEHPYAEDLDLVGPGSLLHRIDTTQTTWGEQTLVAWLSEPASAEEITQRQVAVEELSHAVDLRQELEAWGTAARSSGKLSGAPFIDFARRRPWVVGWRRVAALVCPVVTLFLLAGRQWGLFHGAAWLLLALPQMVLVALSWKVPFARFALLDARRPPLEALAKMLAVVEGAHFESPRLRELRARLHVEGRPPSAHLRTLATWAGWADLRFQVLVHPSVNLLFMWDWHVLWGLERWNRRVGARVQGWLEALAEIEALASLSVLRALDDVEFPVLTGVDEGLRGIALGHPLIPLDRGVSNDVAVDGPGYVLVVTGSNMAGKSTLLRAVGLNIALALAGGPVCARSMSLPRVRLRSSMRVGDSLQSGASYFYAELARLKVVVADPGAEVPIFFLFDELLRGTNASARRTGASAIVLHLVAYGGFGVVATHDDALCNLAGLPGIRAGNVHLTDVIVDGEMVFDYRLRPGRATTSNALALLERAGIPLPDAALEERLARPPPP